MDRFLVLIGGFALFILILKYRYQLKDFFGNFEFAEKYLGGTYNLIIISAIAVLVLSLMYALGTLQAFLQGTVGPLFGGA